MQKYELERFAAVTSSDSIMDMTFSPDGRWVAYVSSVSGQFNVWKQSVHPENDDGTLIPVQLTSSAETAMMRAIWSPNGDRLLTLADPEGTENYQIYGVSPDPGRVYAITDNPGVTHEIGLPHNPFAYSGMPFSPDGRHIAYSNNERSRSDFDVLVRNLATGETRSLFAAGNRNYALSWSPDGRSVLVERLLQHLDQDLFLCDVPTGECRHLTPHEGEVKYFPGPWRPDGSGFYLTTNAGREFSGMAFFHLQGNRLQWLETPDWDVAEIALSRDGRQLAWLVNEDGYTRLYSRDTRSGTTREYPQLPRGHYFCMRFSPTDNLLGLFISTTTRPPDMYMLNVDRAEYRQFTHSFQGGIPEDEMVTPERVRYKSFDGRQVPALLYKPRGLAPHTRVPVVVSIHGGPEVQELPVYNYDGLYQYLLNRGIGLLATNIRGSTGYGKTYQRLVYRDWGGGELKDLQHGAEYLRSLDWVDPDKLGVFGGSFGGFEVLSCITRLPEYWSAAVDLVGPANLVTLTKTTLPSWKHRMKAWIGDPIEDAATLEERSPINYIDNIRAPLLVIQGANDPRMPRAESDRLVERLLSLGRTVEYILLEDEGHAATKTSNKQRIYGAVAGWFEKHLLT
jgi:dipeptidyl aminopeptidase/acylaminoacyl peptidase